MKTTVAILLIMVISVFPVSLWAGEQDIEKKYQLGMHSAIITGKMEPSQLDSEFDDLSTDGIAGPHASGVFFLYAVKPFLRIGFKTLAGNSDENEATTMNFQAAGPVVDVKYGNRYFIAGGIHAGTMIVNATHRNGETSKTHVNSGAFYKKSGMFLAPYVGVGATLKSYEIRVFVKQALVFGKEDANNIDAFNGLYAGVSVGINF